MKYFILLFLVSFSFADCRYKYKSTTEPLKTFLDEFLLDHIGVNYSASNEVLNTSSLITIEGCYRKSNYLKDLKKLLKPKELSVLTYKGFLVIVSTSSKHFIDFYTSDFIQELQFDLYKEMNLEYLKHYYDKSNQLLVIRDTQKNISLFKKHLKNIKNRKSITLEFNIHEVLVNSERSEGFVIDGFFKGSYLALNDIKLGRLMDYFYTSDSSVYDSRLLSSHTLKTKSSKELNFFTGLEIEKNETFNSDGVVSTKTIFKNIGLNILFKCVYNTENNYTCSFDIVNSSYNSTGDLSKFSITQTLDLMPGQITMINLGKTTKTNESYVSNPVFNFLKSFFSFESSSKLSKFQMITARIK
jgi:hypothetical protein